jgi:hypothetical protein
MFADANETNGTIVIDDRTMAAELGDLGTPNHDRAIDYQPGVVTIATEVSVVLAIMAKRDVGTTGIIAHVMAIDDGNEISS